MQNGQKFKLLRQFPLKWALCWVLLPNLAVMAMWAIGGPAMSAAIMACGLLAILVSHSRGKLLRAATMVLIFFVMIIEYTSLTFNLGFNNLLGSVVFLKEMDPTVAPEYFVGGSLLLVTLLLAVYFAPRTAQLVSREQKLMALAAVSLMATMDTVATAGTRGSYKASAPAGTKIDSAIIQNHIAPATVSARNLVVIIVEAWGVPNNAEDKAVFAQAWNPARWAERYDVRQGVSAYYGSTTNAELREWCGVWADHFSFDFDKAHCLPEKFRQAGFRTVAMHSFDGAFFDRTEWYPKLGFEKREFSYDLNKAGARPCGGVYPGVCDRDVPRLIGDYLRGSPEKRNLVYWLPVNGHLPVVPDQRLGTDNCNLGTAEWRRDFGLLCRNYQIHAQIADAVTAEIMKPDFPEADILIVGDHMPPFFTRAIRTRFDSAHVPWVYLRSKQALERARARTAKPI